MIFPSVLLPAPFSPSRAWIWLRSTVSETWSFARQPGYCLVIPVIVSNGPGLVMAWSRGKRVGDMVIPSWRSGQFAVHALDQPLHAGQRAVIHGGVCGNLDRAGLIRDRADEHLVLAGLDGGLGLGRQRRDVLRHIGERRHRQHPSVE